jgi:hypothetical protein
MHVARLASLIDITCIYFKGLAIPSYPFYTVSRELASKAYYKVKTVVWTPFWPSGTADIYIGVACYC